MLEEKFSAEDSLKLIHNMIARTKRDISGNAHYFLVWGWITFIACIGQFILKHIVHYDKHYLVWSLTFVGIAYTLYMGYKKSGQTHAKTYIDDSMKYLWIGMAFTFFVLSFILTKIGWGGNVFPFFIILYALGTFVSGCILMFRPLIIGGILSWVIAIISVFLDYDYQILAAAVAILVSYIIPAYMFRKREATDY